MTVHVVSLTGSRTWQPVRELVDRLKFSIRTEHINCLWYTCVLKIPQPRNFLTMLRKRIRTCTKHKNYRLAYLKTVATGFSNILYSAGSRGKGIIAIFIPYSMRGFRSTVLYGFIHLWFNHRHGLRPQSESRGQKRRINASNCFPARRATIVQHAHFRCE